MDPTNGVEGQSIQDLAAQMMGLTADPPVEDNESNEEESEPQAGHPAWQGILDNVSPEHRQEVMDQLHDWDAGVSRKFQKIHDEYAPLKQYEELGDPDDIKQAVEVYQALLDNPKDTWETIGRVYGLSLNSEEEEDDDDEYEGLSPALRERLAKLDEHERVLGALVQRTTEEQAAAAQAQEDQEFEEYLESLTEEYGEYDEDFVVGLIAAGVDGDEAVERYQELVSRYTPKAAKTPSAPAPSAKAPQVMSGSGGIPTSGSVELGKMSNAETQELVMQALKLTQSN